MTKPSFAGLAPSIIYAAVAEAVLYDDLGNEHSNTADAIIAGLEIEIGNNGAEAFFRGVADEIAIKEAHFRARKAGLNPAAILEEAADKATLEAAFQAAQQPA